MSKKAGLGMGYSSLLGEVELEQCVKNSSVPLMKVQPGLNQPRKKFDPQAITELAESIRHHGIIQPLTVRLLHSGYYEIVAGERRWRAAKELGLEEVPVLVIEADDRKVMEIGLIENLQREDLNPMEEARGYQVLMVDHQLTQDQLAEHMGKSRPAIANALRLLGLPLTLMDFVEDGKLSAGHARAILAAPSEEKMQEVAEMVIKNHLSVRRTEELVRAMKKEQEEQAKPATELEDDDERLYLREFQDNLTQILGRRVLIQHQGKKGKIVMEYSDTQDLTGLVEVLTALQEDNHGE